MRTCCAAACCALAGVVFVAAPLGSAQPPARRASLVVTAGTVITMDPARRVLTPGAIAIDAGAIIGVGTPDEVRVGFSAAQTIDAPDQIALPGLINTHGHAPMVLYRGLADDLALMDWLQRYIFPAEAKTVTPAFVRAGTRLAALEMIQSGTTTFADMYYFEEAIAEVVRDAGLRAVLGETIIQFPSPDAKTPREGLARTEAFIQSWKGHARVTPAVAPHAMYTLDAATLLACRDLAKRYEVPVLIHLAETREEGRIAAERHKLSPVKYLSSIGFWAPRTLAAHGVWLDAADINELKAHAVAVAHNPESNMKLASGTAPVPRLLAAGVPVGLGTDGAASNNDLDMFEAMRQAAFLHKLSSGDPRVMGAATVLEMATLGGARALGMGAVTGSIEIGKRADVILVGTSRARQTPMYDPVSHLVYVMRGDDVQTTIVEGSVLMRDRVVKTLDERAVIVEARQMAEDVKRAVRP